MLYDVREEQEGQWNGAVGDAHLHLPCTSRNQLVGPGDPREDVCDRFVGFGDAQPQSWMQMDDQGMFNRPSLALTALNSTPPLYNPLLASPQYMDSQSGGYPEAYGSIASDVDEAQVNAWEMEDARSDVVYTGYGGSDIVELVSGSMDSVTQSEQETVDLALHENSQSHDSFTLDEGRQHFHISQSVHPNSYGAFGARELESRLHGQRLEWALSHPIERLSPSPEYIAEIANQPRSVILSPAQQNMTEAGNALYTHQGMPTDYDMDPIMSIGAMQQEVNGLLAQGQITGALTHQMVSNPQNPQQTFSGVGYPPRFELRPRQSEAYGQRGSVDNGSQYLQAGLPANSQYMHSLPDHASTSASLASAPTTMATLPPTTDGIYCNTVLANGTRCTNFFKGKHAKSHCGRHRRLKHEGRTFSCQSDGCERDFTRRSYRSKHYTKHHPELAMLKSTDQNAP